MESEKSEKQRQADFFNICENCQDGCCNTARPPLTITRKRAIRSFLSTHKLGISAPFEKQGYSFPRETDDGYCIFNHKPTKRCQIHSVKPETCVAGPITFDINRQTGKIEWFLKKEKICPLAGALNRDKETLLKHVRIAKREILRLVGDLDEESLRAILTIEEPDTFKIDEDNIDSRILAKLKP